MARVVLVQDLTTIAQRWGCGARSESRFFHLCFTLIPRQRYSTIWRKDRSWTLIGTLEDVDLNAIGPPPGLGEEVQPVICVGRLSASPGPTFMLTGWICRWKILPQKLFLRQSANHELNVEEEFEYCYVCLCISCWIASTRMRSERLGTSCRCLIRRPWWLEPLTRRRLGRGKKTWTLKCLRESYVWIDP